jgi:integrase
MGWPYINRLPGGRWQVDTGLHRLPKRWRYNFASRAAAETKRSELATLYADYGRKGFMSDEDRADVLAARAALQKVGLQASLSEVTAFFIAHKRPNGGDILASTLFERMLLEKKAKARPISAAYERGLREILGPFLVAFNGPPPGIFVSQFRAKELEEHIRGLTKRDGTDAALSTKGNLYTALAVFFNYAVSKGHLPSSPLTFKNEWKEAVDHEPGILTIAQAQAFVREAWADYKKRKDWSLLAYALFGLFCGVRRDELLRLRLDALKQDQTLEVPRIASKVRAFRKVPIPENAWTVWSEVRLPEDRTLPLVNATNFRRHFTRVREAADINSWPKNAQRHSFASYFYAATQDRAELMRRLGHTSDKTTFEHYTSRTSEPRPQDYFTITATKAHARRLEEAARDKRLRFGV